MKAITDQDALVPGPFCLSFREGLDLCAKDYFHFSCFRKGPPIVPAFTSSKRHLIAKVNLYIIYLSIKVSGF